jgi:4-hydroxy-tetrahydrodipicolinate synthase
MSARFELEGVYTPVITPFDAAGGIDLDALAGLVDRLAGAGVHGLVSGGSTGENDAETVDERLWIARFIVDRAAGRLPVFVGVGAMWTPDSIALARGAREIGADGVLLATPPYSMPTERENALNALAIDRAADLPAILYNYPARMGVGRGPSSWTASVDQRT